MNYICEYADDMRLVRCGCKQVKDCTQAQRLTGDDFLCGYFKEIVHANFNVKKWRAELDARTAREEELKHYRRVILC